MPLERIEWVDAARIDVSHLDRATALRIFDGILRYSRTGV